MTDQSTQCSICGAEVNVLSEFCDTCISPINISKLADYDVPELMELTSGLLNSISPLFPPVDPNSKLSIVTEYLNCFWLRPETALYLSAEYLAIRKLLGDGNTPINADIGCGDGIHSSIINGWKFENSFDAFGNLDSGNDDIFNSRPKNNRENILRARGTKISLGLDIKENSVLRSRLLQSFEHVRCSNFLEETTDDRFQVIFSNLIRDFKDEYLRIALNKISEMTAPGGHLVFSSPTEKFKENLYFAPQLENEKNETNKNRLKKLNRGRSNFCVQQISAESWEEKLHTHGFEIEAVEFFGAQNFLWFWDTGLRSFLPAISKLIGNKSFSAQKQLLKSSAVDLMAPILEKFLLEDAKSSNFGFQMILAKKRK